jgi:hypothetical protein
MGKAIVILIALAYHPGCFESNSYDDCEDPENQWPYGAPFRDGLPEWGSDGRPWTDGIPADVVNCPPSKSLRFAGPFKQWPMCDRTARATPTQDHPNVK